MIIIFFIWKQLILILKIYCNSSFFLDLSIVSQSFLISSLMWSSHLIVVYVSFAVLLTLKRRCGNRNSKKNSKFMGKRCNRRYSTVFILIRKPRSLAYSKKCSKTATITLPNRKKDFTSFDFATVTVTVPLPKNPERYRWLPRVAQHYSLFTNVTNR